MKLSLYSSTEGYKVLVLFIVVLILAAGRPSCLLIVVTFECCFLNSVAPGVRIPPVVRF